MKGPARLTFLVLALAFALCGCSKSQTGNSAPAASPQLSWDQGNWDQKNWQ